MRVKGKAVRWNELGEGTYNTTTKSSSKFKLEDLQHGRQKLVNSYHAPESEAVSQSCFWVKKEPKKFLNSPDDLEFQMNHANRATRVANQLNPTLPAISISQLEQGAVAEPWQNRGWLMPYIEGRQATDAEIAKKLVEIYRAHRRIVVDACSPMNFITDNNGQVHCIDVDQAVAPDSPVSHRIHQELIAFGDPESVMNEYWDDCAEQGMPKTVQTIKALLYLEQQLPQPLIRDCYITSEVVDKIYECLVSNKTLSSAQLANWAKVERQPVVTDASFMAGLRHILWGETDSQASESPTVIEEKPNGNGLSF